MTVIQKKKRKYLSGKYLEVYMENIEERIMEIAPGFFLVVMLLPIIFASIGGAKFMEAAENLKKDGENFQYKKSLLIAKELLICAFLSCGVWLSFCIVGESSKGSVANLIRIMMVSYKMASIGVILAYFTIFVMLIHENKKILDNDVYKKMLSKHKKKLTIIFLIIFIVYISWYTYLHNYV